MGIILKWKVPDLNEVTYDKVYIYRSTSKDGLYTEIASQNITDNSYFDIDGTSSNWYKVRFYDSVNNKWSDYSYPIRGGTWYGYCTPDDVRILSTLTPDDVSDSVLYDLISYATVQINHEICSKIIEEPILPIDSTRKNEVNGVNDTFYVSKSFDYYIGDLNDDGIVDENDVIVYDYAPDGTKTKLTVSSVDPENGSFTLSSPPQQGHKLTVTYTYSPVLQYPPHPLLTQACAMLTISMAHTKIDKSGFEKISLGKLSVSKGTGNLFTKYYNSYSDIIKYFKTRMLKRVSDTNSRYWLS